MLGNLIDAIVGCNTSAFIFLDALTVVPPTKSETNAEVVPVIFELVTSIT